MKTASIIVGITAVVAGVGYAGYRWMKGRSPVVGASSTATESVPA